VNTAQLRALTFVHKRVVIAPRWHERLLDAARADPAQQVEDRAGLVVGAGGAGTAKRLLADDGAGGFVVDVEVACGVAQALEALLDRVTVLREDRTGQCVRAGAVDELQCLILGGEGN